MKRALLLCCASLAAAIGAIAVPAVLAEPIPVADEQPKRSDCTFLSLNGVGVIDDRTAILEMSTRHSAPQRLRRWFKVTFATTCRHLKGAHFFDIHSAGCPRHGDVLVFSSMPFAKKEHEIDTCMIDTAEEVPVPASDAAQPPT